MAPNKRFDSSDFLSDESTPTAERTSEWELEDNRRLNLTVNRARTSHRISCPDLGQHPNPVPKFKVLPRKKKAKDYSKLASRSKIRRILKTFYSHTKLKLEALQFKYLQKTMNRQLEVLLITLMNEASESEGWSHGCFTFDELESRLQKEKLIDPGRNVLSALLASLMSPTRYRKVMPSLDEYYKQ